MRNLRQSKPASPPLLRPPGPAGHQTQSTVSSSSASIPGQSYAPPCSSSLPRRRSCSDPDESTFRCTCSLAAMAEMQPLCVMIPRLLPLPNVAPPVPLPSARWSLASPRNVTARFRPPCPARPRHELPPTSTHVDASSSRHEAAQQVHPRLLCLRPARPPR
jgi:hypothetical protein